MTAYLMAHLLAHGWHVWPEWHPYYSDHARGGWIEWLASRTGWTQCAVQLHHGSAYLNQCQR